MKTCPDCGIREMAGYALPCPKHRGRLKGMQGPEQGLVGESRSGSETGPAEEAKPGERDVGEIVELSKLLRHVDSEMKEAQSASARYDSDGLVCAANFYLGQLTALASLRKHIENTAEKRSDLSHSQADPSRSDRV